MEKVLVINDLDGHCNVFDISTVEKETKIYKEILQSYLDYLSDEDEIFCERIIDTINQDIISQSEISDILEEENDDFPGFDRSNGGRMYIVDVKSTGITSSLFL